jgi:hypothetical protein
LDANCSAKNMRITSLELEILQKYWGQLTKTCIGDISGCAEAILTFFALQLASNTLLIYYDFYLFLLQLPKSDIKRAKMIYPHYFHNW